MKTLVIAHKGDLQNAPESSLAAFSQAIAKGAAGIEFDVHLTKDEQLVIHHDYYLGRTENGQGAIADFSLAELSAFDIGHWFSPDFAGQKMLNLAEVLELGQGRVRFEIDMRTPTLKLLGRILGEIDRFGVAHDVELTSVHTPLLMAAKQVAPTIPIGAFFAPFPEWMTDELGQSHIIGWMTLMDAQVAHLHVSQLDEKFVCALHERGYLVHGANLNSAIDIKAGLMAGVDQFSTDTLDLALSIIS